MRKAALALATLALAAAAFAPLAPGAGGTVNVTLKEFTVGPSPKTITAGKVTFKVRNAGKIDHELVVAKTNTAPGKLKVKNNQAVVTGKVGQAGPVKPGKSASLTKTLTRGKYVLLCNLPAHYQANQFAGFVVK